MHYLWSFLLQRTDLDIPWCAHFMTIIKTSGVRAGYLARQVSDLLFDFTGGGTQLEGSKRIPKNWVIDWSRFVGLAPHDGTDGLPARVARKIDTELAPPLNEMAKEGNDETDEQIRALFKSLARRNLSPWLQSKTSYRSSRARVSQAARGRSIGANC